MISNSIISTNYPNIVLNETGIRFSYPMKAPLLQTSGTTASPPTSPCLSFSFPSPFIARSFTTAVPQRSASIPIRFSVHRAPFCLAQGFSNPPSSSTSSSSSSSSSKHNLNTATWAQKYKSYVKRNGELLCAMAWEGYERLGRGAVFANYSEEGSDSMATIDRGDHQLKNVTPSFYVNREKLIEKNEKDKLTQMAPILTRIATYDPQTQFVVVFQADGTQGADIVTPNQTPSEVWARTRKDGGKMFDWEKKN